MIQNAKKMIIEHIRFRPKALPQDIYKLLYQGVFGVGHIISEKAWDMLVEEIERIELDDQIGDPLLEPVHPNGSMIRVNLRQYIKRGGDLETLFNIMMKSASTHFGGNSTVFLEFWSQFRDLVIEGKTPYNIGEVQRLDNIILGEGIKAQHHTKQYREAYYPAYRVVSREVYREFIEDRG
jgi:hypothetical protein